MAVRTLYRMYRPSRIGAMTIAILMRRFHTLSMAPIVPDSGVRAL
jgi:hypothetical protein